MKPDRDLIAVARGNRQADLILSNARIVNVFSGEIESGNIAVYAGRIAGIGDYHDAIRFIDLEHSYVLPGFIDGHVHLESSMLDATQYARAVVPHGTLSIVTDLHEIANVAGMSGIKYILDSAKKLPLNIFLMAPPCVPATGLETSGAAIGPQEIRRLLRLKECVGLGEVMNYPGILLGDGALLEKLEAAGGKVVDGHSPSLSGKDLNAYISAGIMSDHESVAFEEAEEKLRRGMRLMIRESSSEKNLEALLPLVTDTTCKRCIFVSDDLTCADILYNGDMDAILRKAVGRGLDPVWAIQMATINAAEYFRLDGLGAVAPGYFADLVVTGDLVDFDIDMVFHRGELVARAGKSLFEVSSKPGAQGPKLITDSVNIRPLAAGSLKLAAKGNTEPVIEVVPGQVVTRKRMEKVVPVNGVVLPDIGRDILKLVVVERHKATGNMGIGLVKGFGLKRGALASSVAHDSHNIVVVGAGDDDIVAAINEIVRLHGGLVVAAGGKIVGSLALPVAGLLSDLPLEEVSQRLEELEKMARGLGCVLPAPFAAVSFLALPVIPELRLTDLGLVDVNEFKLIKR